MFKRLGEGYVTNLTHYSAVQEKNSILNCPRKKQHHKTYDATVTNGKFVTTFCYVTVNWILF